MNDLSERKRLLVMESDLHRAVIALECAALREQINSARSSAQSLRTWLVAGSAVAGLVAAETRSRLTRLLPLALSAWRWWRKQLQS